jgi:hypothetical protein
MAHLVVKYPSAITIVELRQVSENTEYCDDAKQTVILRSAFAE